MKKIHKIKFMQNNTVRAIARTNFSQSSKNNFMSPVKTKKGFSLMELLVAATIFAMALVIAFGAFSLSLGNQNFVQSRSDINLEGARIARQLSDDIINANGFGSTTGGSSSYQNIKGLSFAKPSGEIVGSGIGNGMCVTHLELESSTSCETGVNTLVLFYKNPDKVKVYRYDPEAKNLWSQTFANTRTVSAANIAAAKSEKVNNDKVEVSSFGLTGATCIASLISDRQPFAGFSLGIQTKDYDRKAASKRAKFNILTSVTSRIQ